MENVVLPELLIAANNLLVQDNYNRQNINLTEQNNQTKIRGIDSTLTPAPFFNFLLRLSPKSTLQALLLVIISLCFISFFGRFSVYFLPDYPLRDFLSHLFNVDRERNFPSLYSAFALVFCFILLFIIAYAKKVVGEAYIFYWRALAIIFVCLSIDELMSFHEFLIELLRKSFNTSGFLYYAWVIAGAIFVLIFILTFLRFITALPAKIQRLFIIAGTVYVAGTLGMEMISGYYTDMYSVDNIIYDLLTTIEEFLEMLGIVIFIYSLMSYISTYMKGISLKIVVHS